MRQKKLLETGACSIKTTEEFHRELRQTAFRRTPPREGSAVKQNPVRLALSGRIRKDDFIAFSCNQDIGIQQFRAGQGYDFSVAV